MAAALRFGYDSLVAPLSPLTDRRPKHKGQNPVELILVLAWPIFASGTCGSHFKSFRARVMSGLRCLGSSRGSGLKTILLRDPMAWIISRANSSMVIENLLLGSFASYHRLSGGEDLWEIVLARTPKLKWRWLVGQASSLSCSANISEKISRNGRLQLDRQDACPTTGGQCRLRSSG
jgi:hypothetical protein